MNTLRELVNKIYNEIQSSEWINKYPELLNKQVVADELQDIALNIMPNFVPKDKLSDFVEASEKSYTETTFKLYISNYSEFLNEVENQFYQSLLVGLAE